MQRCEQPIILSKKGVKGGPVAENSPASAVDTGSIPGQGTKILHAIRAAKPTGHNWRVMCCNERCHTTEQRSCLPQFKI